MEDGDGYTSSPLALAPPATRTPSAVPVREDCWSEDATQTLVDAWGDRYLELNRGNLRQQHWQEVAEAVNAVHGHVNKKARRTDVQCKNRIDTLKKKYKIEKARVSSSDGGYVSQWVFFTRLDALIGTSYKPSPPLPAALRRTPRAPTPLAVLPPSPSTVPVGPRSKRPVSALSPGVVRRNFSTMAAAAAAAEAESESETSRSRSSGSGSWRREGERNDGTEWCRQLAEAIERVGEIYGRVEEAKQRQMIELEKQRMQFAKDLEIQRMKLYMDAQIQLEKIKRAKQGSESDSYL